MKRCMMCNKKGRVPIGIGGPGWEKTGYLCRSHARQLERELKAGSKGPA